MNGLMKPYWVGGTIFGALVFGIVAPIAFESISVTVILGGATFGAGMGYLMSRFMQEEEENE